MALAAVPVPAWAQTAEEVADQWLEANRGDRDWRERATEQLTRGAFERLFGAAAQGTMKQITNMVVTTVEGRRQDRNLPVCARAALERAFDQTLKIGQQEVLVGAAETIWSAGGGAAGGAGTARDIVGFFGRRMSELVYSKLRDRLFDEFKQLTRDEMRKGKPEHYSNSDARGACRTYVRIVWDRAAERYNFLFTGDCGCTEVNCGPMDGRTVRLGRWTIRGWGTVIPDITQRDNGDKVIRFQIGRPQAFEINADCCGMGKTKVPRTSAGDEWVGTATAIGRTPAPTPAQPTPPTTPQPPREATPGGQSPRPTRPAAQPPIALPPVPEGPLTMDEWATIYERAQQAEERLRARHRDAEARTRAVNADPAASDADKAAAAADEAAALDAARAATQRRLAIWDKMPREQNQQQEIGMDPRRQATGRLRDEGVAHAGTGGDRRGDMPALDQPLRDRLARERPPAEPYPGGERPAEPAVAHGTGRDGAMAAAGALGRVPGPGAGPGMASPSSGGMGPSPPMGLAPPRRPPRVAAVPSAPSVAAGAADLAGSYRLADAAAGAGPIRLERVGEQLRMRGAGPAIMLTRDGSSWSGRGATLYGVTGQVVTLRVFPGWIELNATAPDGSRRTTTLER